jgi:ClpP class serine protease
VELSYIFWFGVFLLVLQPVLWSRMQDWIRQKRILEIERRRGSRLILLVHREERVRFFGLPIARYIDMDDSERLLRAIQMTDPDTPLDIVLHTPGGLYLAAFQIAHALTGHKGKVTVFVPHYAMSGGTLIALAADEIVMCRHSVLGPVDPLVEGVPASSLLKVLELKSLNEIEDDTIILADVAEKAIAQVNRSVREFLADHMDAGKAEKLAQLLTSGRWTHDYAITADEALDLGLPVRTDMPEEILDLMALYPQPVHTVPTVDYTPMPFGEKKPPALMRRGS